MMEKGFKAVDFTLQNSEGEQVTLFEELKHGPVVLLFFPLAFSSVCTDELCKVRDNNKYYKSLDANVLAISVDSFFSLKAFKKANNLPVTLLSDFNKEVSEAYGVLNPDFFGMKGVSKRAAFVIESEGEIVYTEILDDAGKLPNFNAIHESLEGI